MKKSHSRPIEFSCDAPQARAVFVAGTFNEWKPDAAPLKELPPGCRAGNNANAFVGGCRL